MEEPRDLSISHPVLACAGAIEAALDEVAGVDPLYMTPAAKAAAMTQLSTVISRAQGLLLRVLAAADDVALDTGPGPRRRGWPTRPGPPRVPRSGWAGSERRSRPAGTGSPTPWGPAG